MLKIIWQFYQLNVVIKINKILNLNNRFSIKYPNSQETAERKSLKNKATLVNKK